MTPYLKTILRDLGLFLHVPAGMALLSLPICWLWQEGYATLAFVITAAVALAIAQGLYRCFSPGSEPAHLRHAMLTVALAWGIIPLLGAIPFLIIATHLSQQPIPPLTIQEFQDPLNALFESFSGFTSTGLSMARNPEKLPHSLQWWRSFIEWVGGVGVIVLILSVLEPSTDAYQLYYAEARQKKIALTVQETVRKIWWIYLIYTIGSVMWLRIAGMPWWEALNHGLTGIATGGFSIRNDSIGAYSPWIQFAVIPVMILGAISFPIHALFWRNRRLSVLWSDSQHRALWIILGCGTVILMLINYQKLGSAFPLDSFFQWVSGLGTCGFSTVKLQNWSDGAKLLLSVAMIIGGTAGSTVGGIKLSRAVSLYKAILWRFQRLSLQPHQLMRYQLDQEVVTEAEANRRIEAAAVLTLLWLGLLLIGIFILRQVTLPMYNLSDVIFEAASALGSVGLSTGISNPELPALGKVTLILFMWMGRLEIIPVILLLSSTIQVLITKLLR